MARRSLSTYFWLGFFLLVGCVRPTQTGEVQTSKDATPKHLFGGGDIQPKGNSALYYIDSRLYSIRDSDAESLEALKRTVDADPDSAYLHGELSRNLAELNQFEQSTLEADKALALDPSNSKNHLLRGKLYSVQKDSAKALDEYKKCIQNDPDQEECYTMMTREYLLLKQVPAAVATINQLLNRDPDSVQGLFYLGTIYSSYQKDSRKAVAAFKRLLEQDPEDIRGLASLAQLYIDDKKPEDALATLLKIESLAPNDVPMKLRIGLLYYEMKDYDQAIDRFTKALQLSPDNDHVSYYLGLLEAQRKHYDKALQYFRAVPAKSDLYKEAIIRTILVLEELNQEDKAVAYGRSVLAQHQDIPELYEALAGLYSRNGNFKESLRILDQGLARFNNQEKLLFTKGVVLDKMGAFEKSIEVMQALIKVNPQNTSALNYVGYSFAEKGIRLQEALDLVSKANKIDPQDGYITDSLAWVYFKLGQKEKALELLKKANQLSPNEPVILEHLGDLYLERGETEKAKGFFQEAVADAVKQEKPEQRDLDDLKRIQSKLSSLSR